MAPAPASANAANPVAAAGAALIAPQNVARAATQAAPNGMLATAHTKLLNGEYPKAIQEFGALQASYPGTPEAADALYFQADAYLHDDQFKVAEETLRRFLATHPTHPRTSIAWLMLGRALEAQGNGGGAIEAYKTYEASVAGDPSRSLADFIHLKAGQILFASDRAADAWTEMGLSAGAAASSPSNSLKLKLYEDLAIRYWNSGDRANTVKVREAALAAAVAAKRPEAQIAATAWRLVSAYVETGQPAAANNLRRRIVNEWPRTTNALTAMNELGAASVPAFQRSVINFTNRRWAPVVETLTAYINSGQADAEGTTAEARYMRAIALTRMGDDTALEALDRVAERHASSEWADDALWEAASLLGRQNNKPAAAARYEQLAVGYPVSEYRGQALYWLGKLLPELGNTAAGQRYMTAATSTGYEDFWTFRARTVTRTPAPAPKPLAGQEGISGDERAAFNEWLAGRGYSHEAQAARRAEVEADGRFKRGSALLEAGFRADAEQEFLELVRTADHDPVVVEYVAVHVRERGFWPLSVTLGHRLTVTAEEWGDVQFLSMPRVVQKLVLPLAFLGLVEPSARAKNVDPLLLLGLMKQESWFEPRAASTAQARGLTQFIRETATTVSRELEWPGWTWDDMNRPYVSVPFGAHYLSDLIKDFRGNYHFALAGYNGGPGNVLRWAANDWNRDVDLFVEGITFAETRGYVKAVVGNYELYKAIYYR
ncbi:MAG TPA: transglycosylase SLT domain-containing protein [Chloroflexota bacterium]|nr:transglycosylase SLT domain-containing protein [Chloroflexota bacterium]